jgi:acylphosphatase
MSEEGEAKVRVTIKGRVQGVGFRYWICGEARRLGLRGWVRNRPDGAVEALFAGPGARVEDMLAACWRGPNFARITAVGVQEAPDETVPEGFHAVR